MWMEDDHGSPFEGEAAGRDHSLEDRGSSPHPFPASERVRMKDLPRGEGPREKMEALGVAALTDAELHTLPARLESAPAGGDVLAILGIVFLVLLLLEYTGTIDIFKKVP